MKVDLLTIFPGIILETKSFDNAKKVNKQNDTSRWAEEVIVLYPVNITIFKDTRIISFKKLQSEQNLLDRKVTNVINGISKILIDLNGKQLSDFTIIFNKNFNLEPNTLSVSDSQKLILYVTYSKYYRVSADFIKVIFYPTGSIRIYFNNYIVLSASRGLPKLPPRLYKTTVNFGKEEETLFKVFTIIRTKHYKMYKRFINAITLFNESCRINRFDPNSSIVLIVSAFESLLNLPRTDKTEMFSYALKNIMGFRKKIEDWAKELYELRCQIVHGEPIDPKKLLVSKDRHYPHFDIAKKMFRSCLWFILEGYGYIIFDREQKFKIIQNLCNKIISNKEKVKNILKRKNNYSFKAFLDNKKLYEEFIKKTRALTPSDYSAQKELKDLLVIVFEIAKDWIYYETERQTIQSYKNIKAKENFNDIIKLFHEIEKIKWSEKGKLLIDTKIFDIFSKLEEFEHVLTEDIIEFNILYFLQTTLRNYLYIF